MNEDAVPPGDAPTGSAEPERPYDIHAVRLTLGGIGLAFVFWAMGIIYLLDHDIYAHVTDSHGTWPLIVLLGGLALALGGEVYSDILTLKSWLERGLYAATLLLFIGFVAALGIGVADERLLSDYKAVLLAITFCCASLSMTALVWWISLSPVNPLRMREIQRKSAYIGDAIEPRRLNEMTGRGIPLIVATALLAVPPLAALALIAVNWQYASKQVFIYPAGFLTMCGAIILLFVAGIGAWRRGRNKKVAIHNQPNDSN
ncbi:MAG TPA: hypothetical protein VH349_10325 [Ktedonobacterales bacterium]|jgi:uncharacterized membrane protein